MFAYCRTSSDLEIAAIISFKYYICYVLNTHSKLNNKRQLTENTFPLKSANRIVNFVCINKT